MAEEHESLSNDGDEDIPLVTSLASLVEELCTVCHEQTVLSPRNVMLAMDHYIPHFNLTRQQDAEEALSHLLSSMREEISEHFVPVKSQLADLPLLPNGRIVIGKRSDEESGWERWSRSFLKPFDGILGSILVCQSCSFQISLEFQLFHSLHLSLPMSSDTTIKDGSTLEDCLKNFFAAEIVENYFCNNCWHAAAIEYVSSFCEKTDVETLQCCNKNDSCKCKALPSLQAFPWSNRFSRTFKQLGIARSPQGHVSFPLILDMSSFMSKGVGLKHMDSNSQFGPLKLSSSEIRPFPYSKYQSMLINARMPSSKTGYTSAQADTVEEQARTAAMVKNGVCLKHSDASLGLTSSKPRVDGEVDIVAPPSASPRHHQIYRLVSVVVHFGMSGDGHYTVYRKSTGRLSEEDPVGLLGSAIEQWFCISDSEVHAVSEKDVMGANASMLFYEKIGNS